MNSVCRYLLPRKSSMRLHFEHRSGQELEDVANAAAKKLNRVRGQLGEGEGAALDALLADLPPALDLATAGTPTSAGRSAALDRGHAPLTQLCNSGAAAAPCWSYQEVLPAALPSCTLHTLLFPAAASPLQPLERHNWGDGERY